MCSGISRYLPDRLTLFFLSRSPPPDGPLDVDGKVRLRDSAGEIYNQEISAVCIPKAPLSSLSPTAKVKDVTGFVLNSCGEVIGKSGRLLERSSTTKITCYKSYPGMPPLDFAEGSSFHVAAQGESNEEATIIPDSATGDIQSIVAVTVDGINPAWLGISQPADPIEAMQPCQDDTIGGQKVIYPCSAGFASRWVWILVGPAGLRKDCEKPPTKTVKNLVQHSSDMYTKHLQDFCQNVPDGFMCPVTCNSDRAPTGSIQCKNGRWQRSLNCREKRKVCLSPFKTLTVTTSGNSNNLWSIDGIVPDKRNRCDLFSRQGKKCKGTCSGGFGTGQLHCKRGQTDTSLAATGTWQARPNFVCNDPTVDTLYPRPAISFLEQVEGEKTTIRITVRVQHEPLVFRSNIKKVIFKERRNKMKKSTETAPSSETTSNMNSEADDPEEGDEATVQRLLMSSVDGGDHPMMPKWLRPMSRRLQTIETCDEGVFTEQENSCLDGGEYGACWNCLATEVTSRRQCWRGRSGPVGSPRGAVCGSALYEGDYYTCRWVGFTQEQACYARAPVGYCVKKICAYQGGGKTCTEYDPPIYEQFCIGEPEKGVIEHAVIQYTCCDQNVVTYVGTVTGGQLDSMGTYELLVGARNNVGTSWSEPHSITCAALVLTGTDAFKYTIEDKCKAVMPQDTCRVTCARGYFDEEEPGKTNGVYTCNAGLGEALVGDRPKCLQMPSSGQGCSAGNAIVRGAAPVPVVTPAICQQCAVVNGQSGWDSHEYETCRFWGDPHISKSWRSEKKFNHQGFGIYRYATMGVCAGGNFEVQVFQCQYKSGRNSVATGVAVRLNNGATVFVNKRSIEMTGRSNVEPSDSIHRDSQGVNIYSDDKCAFLNVNVKTTSSNPGHMHNVKIKVFNEDLTAEGICGNPELKDEYIAPDSGRMIFTEAQHTALCNECINSGSLAPPGCPGGDPPPLTEDCGFLAPLNRATDDEECTPDIDPKIADLQKLKGGPNCVIYSYLGRRVNCQTFCGERNSECVALIDDDEKRNTPKCVPRQSLEEESCTSYRVNTGICVCKVPENNAPGDDVRTACANSVDNLKVEDAEAMCKLGAQPFLDEALFPGRENGGRRLQQLTQTEMDLDSQLEDCMVDCCSSDPADRPAIIQNARLELVTTANVVRSCQEDSGLQLETGEGAYPCNCAGAECVEGQACLIVNDEGSCDLVPTTTTVVTFTVTGTMTTSTATTATVTDTTRTFTESTLTTTQTTQTTTSFSNTSTTTLSSTTSITTTGTTYTSTTTTLSSTTSSTWSSTTSSTMSATTVTSTSSVTSTSTSITSTSSMSTTTTSTSVTSVTSTTTSTTVTTATRTSTSATVTSTSATLTATTITSTSLTATSTSLTVTTVTVTETTVTVSSTTSSTMTVTSTSQTHTTSTSSTYTTTTTYQEPNHCGPWVSTGGFIRVGPWDRGEVNIETGQGTYEWRVYYTKLPRDENQEFLVTHCKDIQLTTCDIYCLEPGASYDVRVNLVRIDANLHVVVIGYNIIEQSVYVPNERAGMPENLQVLTHGDHTLEILWTPSEEQGNCSFNSYTVEIQAMNGGWLVNPPGCTDLTQDFQTNCTLTGLACDTPYQIQVKQLCENEESNSDWSRPIIGETLEGGACADAAEPPTDQVATTEIIVPDSSGGGRRLSSAECQSIDYLLRLRWTQGEQQDSQFLVWNLEVYKLTVVAGVIDPNGNEVIPGVCQGIMSRETTECVLLGMPFGMYAFSVQEVSLLPETSSPMSEMSNPTWIPRRRAKAPQQVTLSQPTLHGFRVSWVNMPLEDCPYYYTQVEVSTGNGVWFMPWLSGCDWIADPTTSSCTITSGLESNTGYVARVMIQCDECLGTPSSQKVECGDSDSDPNICLDWTMESGCFVKLDAFRAGSCASAPSPQLFTAPRRQAAPTSLRVTVPTDSGVRVTLAWAPGAGSASDPYRPSDCASQSYQLEVKLQTETDWGTPEGCQSLGSATTCTALYLQCNTGYDARVRASCVPSAASSDWSSFSRFSTANLGSCLSPASAPQLLRQTSVGTTSMEVSFTAGNARDCVFGGFELQYRKDGEESWTSLPLTAGSLQVRAGPSAVISSLQEATGYFFRARELCNNGAPLNSPWGNTEEPLQTLGVPPVEQPISIDPLGMVTGTLVPQRLMLFFESDLDLGDSTREISICPSLVGTAEAPGACECVSVADCASNCVRRSDVSVLLMSARVLLVDFSGRLPRPLTGCPYDVVVEEGVLKTQLTPSKDSPSVLWSFTYSPPVPTGSVTLYSSTTTSLTMHVSWDTPMTVTCGVRDGSGGLAQVSAEEDFTGARAFVEVRITGLVPFTQYTVVCTGAAIGDSILTATVTAEGVATERDTDDSVSSISLSIQALCSDNTEQQVTTAALYPPFDPSIRNYQVALNADEVRTWCSDAETEAVLRIAVTADASSSFASVTAPEVQSMVQQLMDENGQLPTGVATSTTLQVAVTVDPANSGTSSPVPYTITFVLGTLDLRIETTTLQSSLSFDETNSASFSISVPSTLGAEYVGLRLGPYEQTLTLVSTEAVADSVPPRSLLTFNIDSLVAMGSELPVIITAQPPAGSSHPTLDVRTGLTVSTNMPVFSSFETNQFNNTLSLTGPSIVTITGTNLVVPVTGGSSIFPEIFIAGIPVACNTPECQEITLQSYVASGVTNLCSDTVITQDNTLSCIIQPTGAGNLGLCLLVRSGVFSDLSCGTVAPPGTVQAEVPEVGGISQPEQTMSGSAPFIVTVDGELPPESVSQGFLQVWASPFDTPPEDPANPGAGFIPLCADAVVTADNNIECFRSQDIDVSQIGSTANVFVQTGQDQISQNLLAGGLTIKNPVITRIERSHEFEVGELQIIVEGENFGTKDNGNMVCSLESFGPQTQSLADLRLATALGDPGYITACEVESHEDTRVVCNCIQSGTQQSVLGTPVDQAYYDEKIPTSGDGRRLQEVDLNTLALQLSPLPVAVAVTYQLECEVLERLNESCDPNVRPRSIDIPQVREWQAVRLKPCPAGEHRVNYTAPDCLQCAPGKFKSGVGPALSCSFCEYGEYMGLPGAGACTNCPLFENTTMLGATEIGSCDCARGFYRIVNESQDWSLAINHGVCQPCPMGAICEGRDILPYSAAGYWTPDRLTFWPCFPDHACLQGNADDPNLCELGRESTSRRCGQCALGSFAHQSECYMCTWVDDLLSWSGLLLWPIGIVLVFVPIVVRQIRSNDMSRTKKQKRMMKHEQGWFGSLGLIDHGEFRMMIIMWTCLQTIWICSLMPLDFTSFAREWLWFLGMFVFDLSIFRPQCALEFPYFWKWLFHWALFFVMIVVLLVIMLAIGRNHKNAQHDWKYISKKQALLSMFSASLLLFTLVHLRDDLIFAQCIACEDGKFCLAEQPVIYCDFADSEWGAMAVLSVMDLFLVIGSTVPILAITIYKSWKWQHGDEIALSSDFLAPWYIYISEMLVERHIGYIKEVREAVPEFEQAYKDLHTDGMRQEVWSKAIDIILAHEAEKAEVFLRRMIRHLYNHNPRFNVVDEDSGPTFALIRAILRTDEDEANKTDVPKAEEEVESLKAADIHHITITLNNLLDTARWTIPGVRVIKRWLGYSWSLVLLLIRFAILTFAMLMPRDEVATVPLAYVITKLVSLVMEAALAPYQWNYLNDWELVVHSVIYVFMMFVVSGWSDLASDVLLILATILSVLPVILRVVMLLNTKDKHSLQDPTGMSVREQDVSYHIGDMRDGIGTRSLGISTVTTDSVVHSGTLEHVRKSIEMVKKKLVTVVEKTLDEDGKEVERTTVTEETTTDAMTYSLDMTKSQVGRIMAGQPETEEFPRGLEEIVEENPDHEDEELSSHADMETAIL